MDSSGLAVRLTSTGIVCLGTVLHALVIYLTWRRKHADSPAYSLFMQIYSAFCIFQFVAGWTLTISYSFADSYVFYNGIGSYLGPVFCYLLTLFSNPFKNIIYSMIPTGMAFRVFIVCGKKLRRKHVIFWTAVIILTEAPLVLILLHAYTPLSEANITLSEDLHQQLIEKAAVFIIYPYKWEVWYQTYIEGQRFYVCVPLTFILGFIAMWKLTRFQRDISPQTAKVQRAFIYLLTFEALSLCLGFLLDITRKLLRDRIVTSQAVNTIVTEYGTCVTSLIPTLQAVAMVCLVPYFRDEVKAFITRSTVSVLVSAPSTTQ